MPQPKIYITDKATYKTGYFQYNNKQWWGKMCDDGTMMFITQKEFELGIKKHTTPPLEPLPF